MDELSEAIHHGPSDLYSDGALYDQVHTAGASKQAQFYKNGLGKDFNFYESIAKRGRGKCLEIACGTGRLTIPLAKAGFSMSGIDNSRPMLDEAEKKSKVERVSINWIQADCTHFSLPEEFSFIYMPCNSLHHLYTSESVAAFLSRVTKHLTPAGLFAFDIFKPNFEILGRRSNEKRHALSYFDASGEPVQVDELNDYNEISQINTIRWFHRSESKGYFLTHEVKQRHFFPQEIQLLLKINGLDIVEVYGGWDMTPLSHSSSKQIFVCRLQRR